MNLDDLNEEKKAIEERNRRRRDRELNDLKKVLSLAEGRRLIWRILSEAGIFRTSFNSNALHMAFNEGGRNLGMIILDDIMTATPETFNRMQREYVSDQKSERSKDVKE
jgi:hypothetical protein